MIHTGTRNGNILFVMLWSLEKYCCAVVLHSKLSARKSSSTENVNAVSGSSNDDGSSPALRSCSCPGIAPGQMQYRTSISDMPLVLTTASNGLVEEAVRFQRGVVMWVCPEQTRVRDVLAVSNDSYIRFSDLCCYAFVRAFRCICTGSFPFILEQFTYIKPLLFVL